jgi:hypothetical protein
MLLTPHIAVHIYVHISVILTMYKSFFGIPECSEVILNVRKIC